jgi:hypothetical protein
MKANSLFLLLLLLSVSFAWLNPPCPSDVIALPLLGVNFTAMNQTQLLDCAMNASGTLYGINLTSPPASQIYKADFYDSTHFYLFPNNTLGGAIGVGSLAYPSSGNFTMTANFSGTADPGVFIRIGNNASSYLSFGNKAAGEYNFTFTDNYSNYVLKNITDNLTLDLGQPIYLSIQTPASASVWLVSPDYNSSDSFEISNFSASGISPYVFSGTHDYVAVYSDKILRSDFTTNRFNHTADGTGKFKAVLYFNTQVIQPLITYFPNVDAIPNYFNISSSAAWLYNNTPAYVYDSVTSQWYLVPPLSVSNYNDIYTISVLFVSTGQTSTLSTPLIPLRSICKSTGTDYILNYSWPVPVSSVLLYANNTTLLNIVNTSTVFSADINASAYPYLNYTANGITFCAFTNSSSTFGLPLIDITGIGAAKFLFIIIWLSSIVVSCFIPFALIFSVSFNDFFSILPVGDMAVVSSIAMIISVLTNGIDKFNVKVFVLYIVLIGAMLTQFYQFNSNAQGIAVIEALIGNLQDITTLGNLNFFTFVAASALFVINMFVLLISVPAIVIDLMMAPLLSIAPIYYTALTPFALAAKLGAYTYIALKAYEVLRNMFREL